MSKRKEQEKKDNDKFAQAQIRISKRDLCDDFLRLYKNGEWVNYFKKEFKYPLKAKNMLSSNNNSLILGKQKLKTNLKTALKIVLKKKEKNQISILQSNINVEDKKSHKNY